MNAPTKKPDKKARRSVIIPIIILVLLIAWAAPLAKLNFQANYSFKSRPLAPTLNWPGYGQAAIGAEGYGVLDSHGSSTQAPMASIAKVITALAVLKQKPLAVGDQGGTITITADDVAAYNNYSAQGGSVIQVTEGEQISEYQALQAMLLPSANNMADTVARWAFGSTANYTTYANRYLKSNGFSKTVVADASGFSDKSVSTAQDLTGLGLMFMKNDVLRQIASQTQADIPVAGTIHSTNWLLGVDNVVGIKTGNTDQAGGCYLFASERSIAGQDVMLVGAVLSAPDLATAISDSRSLIDSADNGFAKVTVATRGQVVGLFTAPWGGVSNVVSKDDVSILTWKSRQVVGSLQVSKNNSSVDKDQVVGTITATAWDKKSIGYLVANSKISKPSFGWRLYKRHI